jgi:hypothetical protein
VGRELGVNDLDGDGTVECRVGGAVDDTHPAPAQLALQPVLRRERGLQGGERVGRRLAHAGTGRGWTVRKYTEPAFP